MSSSKMTTIYLAGPVSNCNEDQIKKWRLKFIQEFPKDKFKFINPADHTTNWSPSLEMIEIEKSDIVVANLWRESIGTVVGILQATRKGKPIVLINPNFIKSSLLYQIVGEDYITYSIEDAINKINNTILPFLKKEITVTKKNPKPDEIFSMMKLKKSLSRLCADSPLLPDLIARNVFHNVLKEAKNSKIPSIRLKDMIFEQINSISNNKEHLYEDDLKAYAKKLVVAWGVNEKKKSENVFLDSMENDFGKDIKKLNKDKELLQAKIDELKLELSKKDEKVNSLVDELETYKLKTKEYETQKDFINEFLLKICPHLTFERPAVTRIKSALSNSGCEMSKMFFILMQINRNEELPSSCKKRKWRDGKNTWEINVNDEDRIFYEDGEKRRLIKNVNFFHEHA